MAAAKPPVLPAQPIPGTNEAVLQMMQMMQAMMGWTAVPQPAVDPAAQPFHTQESPAADDEGPGEGVVRPARIAKPIRSQAPLPTGTLLDRLCLDESAARALGGIPKGCLSALAGPPGSGKMRMAIAVLARVVKSGVPSALVIGDESLPPGDGPERGDLATRLTAVGAAVTRTTPAQFTSDVLDRLNVIESRFDRAERMWDAFIQRYRFAVENVGVRFAVIDAVGMLDPTRTSTTDNLAALKTYNHEHGVTCFLVAHIKESTGLPVGGASLMHTCDSVYFLEEISLGSKEMAEHWGGTYREKITLLSCAKSVTTPSWDPPVRVELDPQTGLLTFSEMTPRANTPPALPQKGRLASSEGTVA